MVKVQLKLMASPGWVVVMVSVSAEPSVAPATTPGCRLPPSTALALAAWATGASLLPTMLTVTLDWVPSALWTLKVSVRVSFSLSSL